MRSIFDLVIFACLCVALTTTRAEWSARRLEAHEWRVTEYDWASGKQRNPERPNFVYSNEQPGDLTPGASDPTKNTGADSTLRVRTNPILYFYGPDTLARKSGGNSSIPIEVAVRFQNGNAQSWWPQLSVYRDHEQVLMATMPGKESVPSFPDHERFQMVWNHLEISRVLTQNKRLPGQNLPANHWFKIAREVESDYLSNGVEVEKFLFYEGKTPEAPAIAIIPQDRFSMARFLVYNVGDHPIYDVFLIYRNKAEKQFWVRYFPDLVPFRRAQARNDEPRAPANVVCPSIPRFEELEREEIMDENEFHLRTQVKLASLLRMDYLPPDAVYAGSRNPAQYQPPAQEHRLFPLEVAAMQKIWNREFFGNEGLTILYRESPAQLDEATPLRIYTDRHHYVALSRCSLVVNRNIDLRRIQENSEALQKAVKGITAGNGISPDHKAAILSCFARAPISTATELEFMIKRDGQRELLQPILEALKSE